MSDDEGWQDILRLNRIASGGGRVTRSKANGVWENMPIDPIAHIPLGDLINVLRAAGVQSRFQRQTDRVPETVDPLREAVYEAITVLENVAGWGSKSASDRATTILHNALDAQDWGDQ